jgi:DNA-binding Lrp family transcriptional regulator
MGRPEKELDTDILYDLLERGARKRDIAEEMGVSSPTLSKRIAKIQREQGLLLQYRALQNLQLTQLQSEILEKITPEKIEEASLRDLVFAYKVLKDKELVEVGKPTEIKGMMHYLMRLEKEEAAAKMPVEIDSEDTVDLEENEDGTWEDFERVPNL